MSEHEVRANHQHSAFLAAKRRLPIGEPEASR
jgi:hypothetical protein